MEGCGREGRPKLNEVWVLVVGTIGKLGLRDGGNLLGCV